MPKKHERQRCGIVVGQATARGGVERRFCEEPECCAFGSCATSCEWLSDISANALVGKGCEWQSIAYRILVSMSLFIHFKLLHLIPFFIHTMLVSFHP